VFFSCRIIEREWLRSAASPDYGGVAAAAEPAPTGSTRHIRVSRWFVCLPLARSGWNRWIHRSERTAYHLQCWGENVRRPACSRPRANAAGLQLVSGTYRRNPHRRCSNGGGLSDGGIEFAVGTNAAEADSFFFRVDPAGDLACTSSRVDRRQPDEFSSPASRQPWIGDPCRSGALRYS